MDRMSRKLENEKEKLCSTQNKRKGRGDPTWKEEQAYLISSRSSCFPWCLTPGPGWLPRSNKQPWHPMDVVQAGEGLAWERFCLLQKLSRREMLGAGI